MEILVAILFGAVIGWLIREGQDMMEDRSED